jgi:hypothetical protein
VDKDTFTRSELEDATRRLYRQPFPGHLLAAILSDVLNHREPEYLNGEMYEDGNGSFYQFVEAYDNVPKHWEAPGVGHYILFESPKRPMHQLVRKSS